MVIPTVAALQYRVGFRSTMLISLFFALFSVIFGMSLSYYFSLPSGATIVLSVIVVFIISLLINKK
jgi:zinc transport system permease protein